MARTFISAGALRLGFLGIVVVGGCSLNAQLPISTAVRVENVLDPSDVAALNSKQERKDFHCTLEPLQPFLDFDLRLHTGYQAVVPLRDLAGAGPLVSLFRVTPEDGAQKPAYFSEKFEMPPLAANVPGDATFTGLFDVGVGKYRVDWLIRDGKKRLCASHWQVDARPPKGNSQPASSLPPETVEAFLSDHFRPEEPAQSKGDGLHVKVLLNLAPQRQRETVLRNSDLHALLSILRNIVREPHFSRFSLVAVNVNEERVIHRQPPAASIDFPALAAALSRSKFGTIDIKELEQKHGRSVFLAGALKDAMASADKPDLLIIVGPKEMLNQHTTLDGIRTAGIPNCPVVYLNYVADPLANPWHDTVSDAVKFLKGHVYTISEPRDLWSAWTSMLQQALPQDGTVASSLRPKQN